MQFGLLALGLVSLVLVLNFQVCQGCSCGWLPFENMYCNSHFVIKVTVLTESEPPWQNGGAPEGVSTTTESWLDRYNSYLEYTYEIGIHEVYKSTPIFEDAEKIITIEGIGGCIRRLTPGTTYFMMGYVTHGKSFPTLSVSFCDLALDLDYDWAVVAAEELISDPPDCEQPEYSSLEEYLNNNNLSKKSAFTSSNLWRKIISRR